jgi:hypothetical protein
MKNYHEPIEVTIIEEVTQFPFAWLNLVKSSCEKDHYVNVIYSLYQRKEESEKAAKMLQVVEAFGLTKEGKDL